MPASWRRLVLVSVAAAAAALGLFLAGWAAALPLIGRIARSLGVARLVFTSPADHAVLRLALGATLALAPLAAWTALLTHRLRRGRDASLAAILLYFAVPLVAVVGGMALRVLWTRAAFQGPAAQGWNGLSPMVTAATLSPHGWGLELGLASAVVLVLAAARRAPR